MFCPTCGKDNAMELKFCASCGTNLEVVSQALTGNEENFFTKMDGGIDQFVARYTEHVFKNSSVGLSDRKVSKSWQLLGQAVLTSLIDILLFFLMWNILPLRFLILLISTPFRLLAARGKQPPVRPAIDAYKAPEFGAPAPQLWLSDAAPSVTEHTTVNLKGNTPVTEKKAALDTDPLK
jgi:hypothetical protein